MRPQLNDRFNRFPLVNFIVNHIGLGLDRLGANQNGLMDIGSNGENSPIHTEDGKKRQRTKPYETNNEGGSSAVHDSNDISIGFARQSSWAL